MATGLSVIIPVWNEAATINDCLTALVEVAGENDLEIIVVDGHPERTTLPALRRPVVKLTSPKGRAKQMNTGAAAANGDILLFLHADTMLPDHGIDAVFEVLESPDVVGGAFDLSIDAPGWGFRLIEWTASRRSRITKIPYGDQAIFLRRSVFEDLGGYSEIPLMEDVALMRTLKQKGLPIVFIDRPVSTSARRWKQRGVIRGTLRNWVLISLYLLGVSPERLARHY